MSAKLFPHPTAAGMIRALNYSSTGIKVEAHFIGVGSGLQDIALDDFGRATVDTLKTPVAWLPILTSKRVSGYQHQMVVDIAGVVADEWNLSELCLADANKESIAIYGSATQGVMTVTPIADSSLIAINMVLGSFPADSIEVIHQGAPLELFMTDTVMRVVNFMGSRELADIDNYLAQSALEKIEADRRTVFEESIEQDRIADRDQMQRFMIDQENKTQLMLMALTAIEDKDQSQFENQQIFNHHTSLGLSRLSDGIISGVAE